MRRWNGFDLLNIIYYCYRFLLPRHAAACRNRHRHQSLRGEKRAANYRVYKSTFSIIRVARAAKEQYFFLLLLFFRLVLFVSFVIYYRRTCNTRNARKSGVDGNIFYFHSARLHFMLIFLPPPPDTDHEPRHRHPIALARHTFVCSPAAAAAETAVWPIKKKNPPTTAYLYVSLAFSKGSSSRQYFIWKKMTLSFKTFTIIKWFFIRF